MYKDNGPFFEKKPIAKKSQLSKIEKYLKTVTFSSYSNTKHYSRLLLNDHLSGY